MPAVVRGAGLSAVGFIGTQAITALAYVALARLAGPSTFGAFAAAAIIVTGGTLFAESGMTAALVQRRGPIDTAAATATVSTLVGGVLLSLLALALSPVVGFFFQSARIGQVSAALSGLLFLHAAAVVPGALLQRRLSLRPRLIVDPIAAAALGVASGIGLALGLGVWGLALGAYASGIVRTGSIWLLGGRRPRLAGASWALWRELAGYARHVVASEMLRHSGSILSTALVGRVLGTAPLGQFRYAWRMVTSGAGLTSVGSYMLLPAFSQIAGEPARFRSAFERSLRVASIALLPVSFLFLALGEPIAVLLFGRVWAEAGRVLVALAGVTAGAAVGSVASETLKAAGRPDVLPKIHGLSAALPIVLLVAFLPLGPVGVGLGFSLGLGAAAVYALLRAASVVGSPAGVVFGQLAAPAAAGCVAAGVVTALDRLVLDVASRHEAEGLGLLACEILLGGILYVALLLALSRPAARELGVIWRLLVPRLRGAREAPLDAAGAPVGGTEDRL